MKIEEVLPPPVSRPWVFGAMALWLVMAIWGQLIPGVLPEGGYEGEVTLLSDAVEGRYRVRALGAIDQGPVLLQGDDLDARRGDVVEVRGTLDGEPGSSMGRRYGSTLDVTRVVNVRPSRFWLHRAGEAVRGRVMSGLQPFDDARGLLAGFLIGDTSMVRESDIVAMRRSGLSHFVAVSGSNVVLFLTLLHVVAGPLAVGSRRRAVVGLLGLPMYVAATGFEPSVMRAAVMAGLVLLGRLIGVVLESWQLLAAAVGALVVIDPGLTSNVGFQLSVAATAGVLVGARWPTTGRIRRAFFITVGAQVAVAPLILLHFGTVPLASPIVNLIAAPLVGLSTTLSALGVLGLPPLVDLAALPADVILALARASAGLPQLGYPGVGVVMLAFVIVVKWPSSARYLVVPAAVLVAFTLLPSSGRLERGQVAVLDVGQGDSILLSGGDGRFALVDGGPDGAVVIDRLAFYGVTKLDLAVLTHVHADHVTGLIEVIGRMEVARVWLGDGVHSTESSARLQRALTERGIPHDSPSPGTTYDLGALTLRVEGPVRRYKSPNDESIVISALGEERTMLLAGDIETVAQADLAHLEADVLKVPHQGAATSSPEWLVGVGAREAVISVGPNQFGHPADWVVDLLGDRGVLVHRTDQEGNIVIDLGAQAGG